ncbi:MAG: hypothetical protein PHD80_04360 [Candidatus ainarchaeum sp.]|nr:hypothetical protein [Candidatus ainarchaeum sp.]
MQKIIIIGIIFSLIISGFFITGIIEEKDTKETQEPKILSVRCCKIPFTTFKTSGGTAKAIVLK